MGSSSKGRDWGQQDNTKATDKSTETTTQTSNRFQNPHRGQNNANNPYAKFWGDKCFKCDSKEHYTGACRGRKPLHLVEGKLEDIEDGVIDEEYVEEEGEELALVLQRVLYSKPSDDNQRHHIFRSKCTVNDKVCQLVLDGGSYENL
ncbi:hypothetical protein CerSpe_198080 [Prunus speciosa]